MHTSGSIKKFPYFHGPFKSAARVGQV